MLPASNLPPKRSPVVRMPTRSNRPTNSLPPSRPRSSTSRRVRPPRRHCLGIPPRPAPVANVARSPKKSDAPPAPGCSSRRCGPPSALLIVFDDGAATCETVRVRGERFVIGRSEGDLLLHAMQVSGRHAELVCHHTDDGSWDWVLTDLGSTNGTFVRAGSAVLKDGQELLIGRARYRFDAGMTAPTPGGDAPASPRTTVTWDWMLARRCRRWSSCSWPAWVPACRCSNPNTGSCRPHRLCDRADRRPVRQLRHARRPATPRAGCTSPTISPSTASGSASNKWSASLPVPDRANNGFFFFKVY